MRQLMQASTVGFAMSIAFGDCGTLIGSAPVLLATLDYLRDLEREADAESVRLMRASGSSSGDDPIGLAFSSHPATAERIEFFENAAQEQA